ncbi:MAG: RagB/SusD family nutrient uptake outer membrane protein [Clostridium sp.]|nr:RagB/SusD family nutrient uptake outer membrane protein [Bacteroides sp.]MCM1198839.1 RagB/SusD family nutrient uptake outer membrane protein [Clostridium sp.]
MRYLKNIICPIAAGLVALAGATSCLEKYPGDAIQEKDAMLTLSDAEQTLIGLYASFKSAALYSGYLTYLPDIQADLAYAVEGFSNTHGDIWQWNIRTTNAEIEDVYASLYTIIGECNFFLEKVGALRESLIVDSEIEALDSWTGEVYCARALAYSELIKCYCKAYPLTAEASNPDAAGDAAQAAQELGVVLRDSYSRQETAVRSNLKESWDFVLRDLEKAETMIDEEEDAFNTVWLTRAAAHAIHARVALYIGNWEDAVKYSTMVIENKNTPFRLAQANSTYTTDSNGQAVSYYQFLWQNDSSYEVIWKIGFNTTSYGGALGRIFLNFTTDYTYYYPDYVPAKWVLNMYDSSDLRYSAFFATQQTGYAHGLSWPLLIKYYGNRDFISNARIYHVNMPKVLRLSEQYLIRAEAYCHQKKWAEAQTDLSTMRKARYSTGGNITLNEKNWLDQISNERVRELYMEGFRLNDLKRWGRGFERTSQTNSLPEGSSLKIEAGDYRFVWPVPNHEIEAPGTSLVQNPGYAGF